MIDLWTNPLFSHPLYFPLVELNRVRSGRCPTSAHLVSSLRSFTKYRHRLQLVKEEEGDRITYKPQRAADSMPCLSRGTSANAPNTVSKFPKSDSTVGGRAGRIGSPSMWVPTQLHHMVDLMIPIPYRLQTISFPPKNNGKGLHSRTILTLTGTEVSTPSHSLPSHLHIV